jgi:hypothetical protein
MGDIPVEMGGLIFVVGPIVAALRRAGLEGRWTPIVSISVGVIAALLTAVSLVDVGLVESAFAGVVIGSSTTGIHQVGKQIERADTL